MRERGGKCLDRVLHCLARGCHSGYAISGEVLEKARFSGMGPGDASPSAR